MKKKLLNETDAVVDMRMVALAVGGVIILLVVLFLGLCVASAFLPVILVLVGIIMAYKGTTGPQALLLLGALLIVAGLVLYVLGD